MKSVKDVKTLIGLLSPDQLSYDNHPFLHCLPANMKIFYNKVLSTEWDILETCTVAWVPVKKALLDGVWGVASNLEGQTAS